MISEGHLDTSLMTSLSTCLIRGQRCGAKFLDWKRRRLWRDEDKIEIVTSAGVGGVTVTQVAQRHEVTRQQIYAWPHDLKKKGRGRPMLERSSSHWIFRSRPEFRCRNGQ